MGKGTDEGTSDVSDTTEGEQNESTEDENTPVIEDGNDQPPVIEEEKPVEEEPLPEESEQADPVEEMGSSIMGAETMAAVTDCTATAPTGDGFTASLTGVDGDNKLQADTNLVLTVSAATGYKVKSVNWAIDGTDQGALTEDGETPGQYTISSQTLGEKLADAATGAITFEVTAVQIFDVTVTVDTAANVQTLAYTIDNGTEQSLAFQASNTVTVEKDSQLSLRVVPADNYEATVTVDGAAQTGSNNVYEIGTITAATNVAITTAEIVNSYAVTETIQSNGTNAPDAAKVATIEYTANCVSVDTDTQAKSIAKGTDLTFKVNEVPGENEAPGSFDGKAVEVSYKIGTGTEKPLTKDANGVYKVEKDEITGAVTIIVNVRDLAEVAVDFTGVNTTTTKLSYKVADAADFAELTDNTVNTVKVQEGKTFSFKVEPKDVYQIDKVTVKYGTNDAEELNATEGVYSFVATNAAPAITVETSYDATKVNSLAFKVVGDQDSYTVAKTAITTDADAAVDDLNNPKNGTAYQVGETVLTKAAKLKVTLTPDVSYDITKVALGTETLYDASNDADAAKNPEGPYAIDFGATVSAKDLTVTTEPKTFENDVQVTFTKDELTKTVVDYAVTGDNVEKKADGSYTIKAGEAYLKFDVTTVGKYIPVVKVNGTDTLVVPEKKDGKYSYTYLVAKLNQNTLNTITVGAQIEPKTVTLVYTDTQVDVSATIGNTAQTPVSKVYTVNDGDTLSFKVTAKDHFVLDKVTTKGAAADAEAEEVTLTNGRFNLKVEEDTTVTITAKGVRSQKELTEKASGDTPAKDKKGAYIVSNTGTYVGGAVEGGNDIAITNVKLIDSKNKEIAMTSGEGADAVKNWSVNGNKTEITLFPSDVIAGKALTLKMYGNVTTTVSGNDVTTEDVVAEYKLAVSANLDAAKVKVSDIKQATDTLAEYPVTVNAGAEVSKIKIDLAETDGDVVKKDATTLVDGKLTVTTGFKAGVTTIKLYVLKDEAQPDAAANRTVVKEVPVTTTALIDKDATKAPKISLASATDVSLTLALDASALKLKEAVTGDVYYEIHATANGDVPKNGTTELLKKDVYKYVKKTADKQNATLWLNASGDQDTSAYGTGGHCKYDVTVRLVHLKDKTDKSEQTTAINDATDLAVASASFSASATTGTKPYETKDPYYEDNLKLKKGTTTVYTGQTAVIATPQFGKNTSYMVVDEDYCADLSATGRAALDITVDPDTNEVKVTANTNTTLGKHTIQVVAISTAEGSEGVPTMYASRATIVVTVVRGIEALRVDVPSDTLFKDPNPKKTATVTAAVTYNNGSTDKNQVPKTKKVEWALLNKDGKVLSAADYLNGKLTIKNGKVTLAKDYVVSRTVTDNQFKIAAIANDFNRNVDYKTPGAQLSEIRGEVAISRTITITNDAMTIGSLAILDRQNKVIARDGGTLEASQANKAKLVAFIPGAPEKAAYTDDDLATYAAKASNVKFTSGNAKAITINADGELSVLKPAKNVVLTAAPGDGNPDKNAKKSMKLTVNYDTTGELGLQITKVEPWGDEWTVSNPDDKTPEFTDSTVAVFALQVQQKNSDNRWDDVADDANFTNYKLAVKGGKILTNAGDGTAMIATASAVTTITLTNNNVKPAVKADYVLTNKGISELAKGTKAPKAAISGKLRADYPYDQQLKVQLSNTAKEDKPEYIKDFSKLYVKVDFDWTTFNVKKPDAQDTFQGQMNPKRYTPVNKDGSFYLDFEYDRSSGALAAGSYKIKINFGEIDEDGNFKSMAPAAAATIKVDKSKKLSFKPVTSYSISATDNGYAVLTGKGTYDSVSFEKLQNANIKGKENKFSRYFKIVDDMDADGNTVQKIMLTENYYTDVNDANINLDFSDKKFKDDLTGYVTYTASDLSGAEIMNTVKITMKVTAPTAVLTKYSLSTSGVVGTAAGSKVRIYVVDNKKNPVVIEDARFGGSEWNGTLFTETNIMEFAAKAALTQPKYDITITFLPADSYYVTEYKKLSADADKTAFIQKYGITLTAKVTAKDLSTINKGRIKIDSKELNQTFVPYMFDGTNYYTYVDYDEVYAGTVINKITNNSIAVGSGDSAPQLIKIERVGEYNTFKVSMSKALFNQAIAADVKADGKPKNTFYDAKGKAKTLSVKADVCYNAEGTQKDSFTFKLTMPANRSAYTDQGDDGLTSYEQAIDALNKNKKAIAANVTVHWNDDDGEWNTQAAQWDLYQEIVKAVGFDSGINFEVSDDDATYEGVQKISDMLKPGEVVEPTTTTDGSLPIRATLKSLDASPKTEIIDFTLTIPKTETDPSDVITGVNAFLNNPDNTAKYSVNTVTEADMRSDLRAYMKTWAAEQDPVIDLTNIRFRIDDFDVEEAKFDEAGDPQAGSVTGKVVIWNIHLNEEYNQEVDIDYKIAAPVASGLVISTVTEALGIGTEAEGANNEATIAELAVANTVAGVKADVLTVAQKAAGFAYTVEYKDDTAASFTFEAVEVAKAGKIAFTLVVKDSDGNYIGEEKNADGTVKTPATTIALAETALAADANIMTVAEAETAVSTWLTAATGESATAEQKAVLTGATEETAADAIATAAGVKSTVTVTVDDFENEAATYNEDGHVSGTVVMSKGGSTNKKEAKVDFELIIPASGAWTLDNAETTVKAAVAKADIYVSNTNVKTDAGKAAVAAQILAAAKAAVPATKYTVAIKQTGDPLADVKLVVVPATAGTDGKVTLVLVITEVLASDAAEGTTAQSKEVTVEHVIPALPAGSGEPDPGPTTKEISEELKTAISNAVKAAIEDTDSPIAIKADTQWNTISEAILNAANGAAGVGSDFEVVAGTTPLELDTNITLNTATINLVVRQTDLTTNTANITIRGIALATD